MSENQQQYTVLARRFRPQTFDEVVGQQHIAQALKNAIAASRVAHAYLFTGARGVGKTSMARILAKALNCSDLKDGNPCNECEICLGISAGHDVDVLEIDGASNRGIDDIRTLRANVNVKSMRTQYKMYIIDEVHMLTKEAFNALLKTLEEPPPNVKFVFATTEPNKLPDTILSRCQRFDFSTIEITSIISRLKQIAESEGYEVSEDALELVARRAAGSMRDSQSLFDQLLAFGEENITAEDVHRLLGTAGDDRLIELAGYMLNQKRKETLECFDKTLAEGVQLGELLDQIINYFRDLMVISTEAEQVSLISVSNNSRQALAEQGKLFGLQTIMAGLQILAETKTKIFRASFSRALVEMALIRITLLQNLDSISDLVAAIRQGIPVPVTSVSNPVAIISTAAPVSIPNTTGSIPNPSTSETEAPAVPTPPAEITHSQPEVPEPEIQKPETQNIVENTPVEEIPEPVEPKQSEERPDEPINLVADPQTEIKGTQSEDEDSQVPGKEIISENSDKSSEKKTEEQDLTPENEEESESVSPESIKFLPENKKEIWSQVLSNTSDTIKSYLSNVSRVAIIGPNQLDLQFPASYSFPRKMCEKPESKKLIEGSVSQVVGKPIQVIFSEAPEGEKVSDNSTSNKSEIKPPKSIMKQVPKAGENVGDDLVDKAVEVFKASIVRVDGIQR
jgi:DNA polymerase III subunit gamma/tau